MSDGISLKIEKLIELIVKIIIKMSVAVLKFPVASLSVLADAVTTSNNEMNDVDEEWDSFTPETNLQKRMKDVIARIETREKKKRKKN